LTYPTVIEGDTGITQLRFVLALDRPTVDDVTVDFATQDGAATVADGDYDEKHGTLTIAAGQQSAEVDVTVHGDTNVDPSHEYLYLNLANLVGADFSSGADVTSSYGYIYEDDNPSLTAAPTPTLTSLSGSIVEGDSGTT